MSSLSAQPPLEIKTHPARWWTWVLISIMVLAGFGLRFSGLNFMSIDILNALLDWYNKLAVDGFGALKEPFSNYTPPYLYLLFLATRTAGFIPKVAAIKLLSICFDIVNAVLVYKILKIRYPQGETARIGVASFFLLPTILLNSGYWGQADGIYTCFLLACLLFLLRDRPLVAMIFLGVSFAFKVQAAFLGPFILLLMIKKKIPWYYLGLVPVTYALMMVPAALTGRPMLEMLKIYVEQVETYRRLSLNAPNLYVFIPDTFYKLGVLIGLGITFLIALAWAVVYALRIKEFTPPTLMLCALVSAAFMPFFLPKMHERYFYLADVLAFLVAFYIPRLWLPALAYQLVSGLVYAIVLPVTVMSINSTLARSVLIVATLINIALMAYLFWKQWKLTNYSTVEMNLEGVK